MPITDAQAEAVTELAKTGGRAIDAGAFIAKTVGTVPEDLIGLAGGDWLHEQRRRNIARIQTKTERILEGIACQRISAPSPSLVLPLLEAAANESREELRICGRPCSRMPYWQAAGFEVVRRMEPIDAVVLQMLAPIAGQSSFDSQLSQARDRAGMSQLIWQR